MPKILVGTDAGCRVFCDGAESELELPGRVVGPFALEASGRCVAIVDQREIWQRSSTDGWSQFAIADIPLQSLLPTGHGLFLGGMDEAILLRMTPEGQITKITSFDDVSGRSEWFAGGPPLGVQSLAVTQEGNTILAAIHVGGIPRSQDGGKTWTPTIPVMYDVHEVRSHPSLPNFVAAATTVGLCVSSDGGARWDVMAEGLAVTSSLAVAVLEAEVIFSVQDGPFAKRSQIWRYPVNGGALELVRQGLPEWLDGKVDTNQIASGVGQVAICDGAGNLWLSEKQTSDWQCIAQDMGYALGLLLFS